MTRRTQTNISDTQPFGRKKRSGVPVLDDRVERLAALTLDLSREIENLLSCDTGIELPSGKQKIDFYREVRNFEIYLIKRALKQTAGSQVKASNLLRLDSTTLNKKIRSYKISL
jgi:transcriptional regulator with PAS, ATPase and Fis domain